MATTDYIPGLPPAGADPALRSYLDRELHAIARAVQPDRWTLEPGVHVIDTNTTFAERVTFAPGAILKPASGVTVTFDKFPAANPSEQIFDLSDGGLIAWPTYNRLPVPVAWFGAIPASDADNSDQDVPINQAIASLGVRGGILDFEGGDYYCSNRIGPIVDGTILRGTGMVSTGLRVSANWANATTYFILFQNSTISQFGCRLENLNVDGNDVAFVEDLIWARSWNELCGFKDVWLRGFMKHGLRVSDYYGGAATSEVQGLVIFASVNATDNDQVGILLDDPNYVVGWTQFIIRHCTPCGNTTNGQTKFTGIRAAGRVNVVVQCVHSEFCRTMVELSGDASCTGVSVQAGGAGDVTNVFEVAADWTGRINVDGAHVGGATNMVLDNRLAPSSIAAPYSEPLIYPPEALLAGAVPVSLVDGITAPGALTGLAQIYVDTADGDLKVKFGDGTVKTIVTDT